MAYAWTPSTQQVADYVTSRTVSATNPGADTPIGDFTADTYPTAVQVERLITGSCAWVAAEAGIVDSSLNDLARTVAALHAAATVELSYPERNADVTNVVDRLFEEAHKHLATLTRANAVTGTSTTSESALVPQYSFPDPVWYGDLNL